MQLVRKKLVALGGAWLAHGCWTAALSWIDGLAHLEQLRPSFLLLLLLFRIIRLRHPNKSRQTPPSLCLPSRSVSSCQGPHHVRRRQQQQQQPGLPRSTSNPFTKNQDAPGYYDDDREVSVDERDQLRSLARHMRKLSMSNSAVSNSSDSFDLPAFRDAPMPRANAAPAAASGSNGALTPRADPNPRPRRLRTRRRPHDSPRTEAISLMRTRRTERTRTRPRSSPEASESPLTSPTSPRTASMKTSSASYSAHAASCAPTAWVSRSAAHKR
ncbi:hypothetical protein L1887_59661 [Cichorium endivia]|nr:hypothetical protein L1887_59661 [Cichorium endivia]